MESKKKPNSQKKEHRTGVARGWAGGRGRWGDVGQRVQTFNDKRNGSRGVTYSMVTLANNAAVFVNVLGEQILNTRVTRTHKVVIVSG